MGLCVASHADLFMIFEQAGSNLQFRQLPHVDMGAIRVGAD